MPKKTPFSLYKTDLPLEYYLEVAESADEDNNVRFDVKIIHRTNGGRTHWCIVIRENTDFFIEENFPVSEDPLALASITNEADRARLSHKIQEDLEAQFEMWIKVLPQNLAPENAFKVAQYLGIGDFRVEFNNQPYKLHYLKDETNPIQWVNTIR